MRRKIIKKKLTNKSMDLEKKRNKKNEKNFT